MEFKLSIIVPVYNTEKYLRRCLDSILLQSYKNIEVIIVNDGSTDHSDRIIDDYCNKDSRFIRVDHGENRGLYRARITGVEHSKGEYIGFVDSDDYISRDFYRELIEVASLENCEIVAGNTVRDNGNNSLTQYTLHKVCFKDKRYNDNEVRRSFYEQEGACYAWHTIWNKIYSKDLWNRSIRYFQDITGRLVMCEDVAFSCILFYNAKSFKPIDTSSNCYYYCVNPGASTDSSSYDVNSFLSKLKNVSEVFEFVESFLKKIEADVALVEHFHKFRMRYYTIWERTAEKNNLLNNKEAMDLLRLLKPLETENDVCPSFEGLVSDCNRRLDIVRELISSDAIDVVSFDIFDTLLLRPLWKPEDLFLLMQNRFEELFPEFVGIPFSKFRQLAEKEAREEASKKGYQDVNLDEIYQKLREKLFLSEEKVTIIQKYEEDIEIRLCTQRKTAKTLFEYAYASGKRIILISDMYLNVSTVETMLAKNGYNCYEKLFLSSKERLLKSKGDLFERAVQRTGVLPERIIHIGDNLDVDGIKAEGMGIKTFLLPKSKDRFMNDIEGFPVNNLSSMSSRVSGRLTSMNDLKLSIGFRSMLALVANRLFDNPFTSWNTNADFDANPYVIGYYMVGMHLLGITKWLSGLVKQRGFTNVCFLARDGYLPQIAFDYLKPYFEIENIHTSYIPCSRMSMMPWIIDNEQGLFNLPVSYSSHTPISILSLLKNYYVFVNNHELENYVKNAGFDPETRFSSEEKYYKFVDWFKNNLFDKTLLAKEKEIVATYYRKNIPEGSLVFDMGYSGRIPYALQNALGYTLAFAYIHNDNSFQSSQRCRKLDIETMYHLKPPSSDLLREFFLSEAGNSCQGFGERGAEIIPIYGGATISYGEKFIQEKILEGSKRFIEDFIEAFSLFKDTINFDSVQVSLPFEGMIHASKHVDRDVLYVAYSDDAVYGAVDKISMAGFWHLQSDGIVGDAEGLQMILDSKGVVAKLIAYTILDRGTLKKIVKKKFAAHPILLSGMSKVYGVLRDIKNKLRG